MPQIYEYHYDGQIRRFLEQIVRAFSGFQYRSGTRDGRPQLQVVPARVASQNRQVANIMRNNSENAMMTVPMITVFISAIRYDRERQQSPNFVSTLQVKERKIDPITGKYTGERGNAYTVQRYMPIPYELTVQVDLWTSNNDQKFQLFEQVSTTFAIGFDIQNSDNPLDWTALTTMYIDDFALSSRTMPFGTDEEIDVATWTFKLPIWLSPPAKVMQQKIIEQVTANIYDAVDSEFDDDMVALSGSTLLTRVITTPGDFQIQVSGNQVKLLTANGGEFYSDGSMPQWATLIDSYGIMQPAVSQLRLVRTDDPEIEDDPIIGVIQYDPLHPNVLLWQIDPETLPANTLPPITGVIDPMASFPGAPLPAPAEGQRYLLLNDLGAPTMAWGTITARADDIIEFKDGAWIIAFHGRFTNDEQYVLNQANGRQLRWTGQEWIMAIDGEYRPGFWHLVL